LRPHFLLGFEAVEELAGHLTKFYTEILERGYVVSIL
jgi:hypothetical protein